MHIKLNPLSLIICTVLLIGFAGQEAVSKELTGEEIYALFSENSFSYKGKSTGTVSYTTDRFKGEDSRNGSFRGSWYIDGNKYCRRFSNGFHECHGVTDNADGTYSSKGFVFWISGSETATKELTGDQIYELFSETTFSYKGKSKGTVSYTTDRFKGKDSRSGSFRGSWYIDGNKYCRRFSNGFHECHGVTDNGDGTYTSKGFIFWKS